MAEKKKINETKVSEVPYGEDKVIYTAPRSLGIDEEDIYVCVRGRRWQIKRGEAVEIPRYVMWVIEDAERQRISALKHIEKTIERSKQALAQM